MWLVADEGQLPDNDVQEPVLVVGGGLVTDVAG